MSFSAAIAASPIASDIVLSGGESSPDLPDIVELGELIRVIASQELANRNRSCTTKSDGSWVTDVDRRVQSRLHDELYRRWPQYKFVGEEMTHANQVAVCTTPSPGYWLLDPLDGTTNFVTDFKFYGVAIALVVGSYAVLAAIFDPLRDECFVAKKGGGAYLNGKPLALSRQQLPHNLNQCIALVDYKRLVSELAMR